MEQLDKMNKKQIKLIFLVFFVIIVFFTNYQSIVLHEESHAVWNDKFNCSENKIKIDYFNLNGDIGKCFSNCSFKSEQEELTFKLGHQMVDSRYEDKVNFIYYLMIILLLGYIWIEN